ncbi:CbtB-domain containing protein [Neorhizobium sp. JUb45]|uniref:CbtB domain-containing protein n=1 Tax=unclassified Neorhizobium TaxID=2629175 RepID=UPI00104A83E9|nr:CbtB-domain containing protein [Neorhizobium sp. JUb45]TCR00119.1 cobalt transporter subunit CbtB [Neorhizobium sp. JUb45]
MQNNTATTAAKASGSAKASNLVQSAMAACLGVFVIGFVGFSHLEVVHNAAHDVRHANAFPCH